MYVLGLTEREKTTLVTLLINEIVKNNSQNDNTYVVLEMEKIIEKIERSF